MSATASKKRHSELTVSHFEIALCGGSSRTNFRTISFISDYKVYLEQLAREDADDSNGLDLSLHLSDEEGGKPKVKPD